MNIQAHAEKIWLEDWINEGRQDYGTCTLGKCLEVFSNDNPHKTIFQVEAPPVQGNISAYDSHFRAGELIKSYGYGFRYNDGIMD
tara:strand:- start:306 stop:560 length:255 start_codon:yes stop_codon:yes gene_type:complete